MATKFLEPGGDATLNLAIITAGGFWDTITGAVTVESDIVHGGHLRSIKHPLNATTALKKNAVVSDTGSRVSFYMYIVALPENPLTGSICTFQDSGEVSIFLVRLTTAGVIMFQDGSGNQVGPSGPTLTTGRWYRISVAYTITSTTINRLMLFVDGVSAISATNVTLLGTGTNIFGMTRGTFTTFETRFSDIYVDDSASLGDTGDIWVTAKRPSANGTAANFTTQIGAGGSGYGSGHSPQTNERALSTTNGWSMIGAGSAVTEEYNIENQNTGDMKVITANGSITDCVGWAYMSSLVGQTVQMKINGVNFAQAITSTNTMYTKVAGSINYPRGTGTDIGIITDTSLTTVSLFECGIMVAFIPSPISFHNSQPTVKVGNGQSRNERAT